MASCDTLKPVVVLTPVTGGQESSEQTEPLNLSLLKNLALAQTSKEKHPDDVIFVKEYKVGEEKISRRGQKTGKGTPRRNPTRKARDVKRFEEYVDESYGDDEIVEDNVEEIDSGAIEDGTTSNADSEDWKVEKIPRKPRQRRRFAPRKLTGARVGRRAKAPKLPEGEKTVPLKDLEGLVESNLLLLKDYINNIKTLNNAYQNKENYEVRTNTAGELLRNQVKFLAFTKDIDNSELCEYLKTHLCGS